MLLCELREQNSRNELIDLLRDLERFEHRYQPKREVRVRAYVVKAYTRARPRPRKPRLRVIAGGLIRTTRTGVQGLSAGRAVKRSG